MDFGKKLNFSKESWNYFVGEIWKKIFEEINLNKDGVLIEVAPGSANKIGHGLKNYGFEGKLFLVEPNLKSLTTITKEYRIILHADIIPIYASLKESIPLIPFGTDAVVSNHPLDDMIISKSLSRNSFDDFFDNHYDGASFNKTRNFWERLENNPNLEKYKEEVLDDWSEFINLTNPKFLAISQYESFFFKSHGFSSPDKYAFQVFENLIFKYGPSNNYFLEDYVEDVGKWLISKNPAKESFKYSCPSKNTDVKTSDLLLE
ncbi:MAG: hypothetical protein NUV46_02895 [Nanoarchaeota archaeon]|nr:hypothetical protein [Nanoarchaeota archaeon]